MRAGVDTLVGRLVRPDLLQKTSPGTKIALKQLYLHYREVAQGRATAPAIWDVGFRVFSEFDEDGILLFLLGMIGIGTASFVDIGSGDGFTGSNTANLALNMGFDGVFIDANPERIDQGRLFYGRHPDTRLYPPRFVQSKVMRSNVNALIDGAGCATEVDVLSIDIDGNDYWIWDAITRITPRIVCIETHVEFGTRSIVVPYDENYTPPGKHPHYHGASPVAMAKLGAKLGYRLVGANRFGFNTFYVRQEYPETLLPTIDARQVLRHRRNEERMRLFEQVEDFPFEEV
jgi:hypothetical protein